MTAKGQTPRSAPADRRAQDAPVARGDRVSGSEHEADAEAPRVNTGATSASHPKAPQMLATADAALESPTPAVPSNLPIPPDELDPVESPVARARALRAAREGEAEVDLELVRRAQKGDGAAFRKLVERHQRRAFAIALSLVRNEQDARDIVQDAFLRVHKSLPSFQGSSSFFTWLYRIVTNLAIDLVRRPGRNTDELEEDRHRSSSPGVEAGQDPLWLARVDGADPIDVLRRKELADRMRRAIDALPSYHKAVILMREVEGMSYEEMGEAMQVSKGTIMSRLFHARQKLQRALADCYEEENPS